VKSGLAFLATEPLKTYEERKSAKNAKASKDTNDSRDIKDTSVAPEAKDPADNAAGDTPDKEEVGMMAGVLPGAVKKDDPKLLPSTPWGRYVKILLSSNEFLFVD
jgi:hypothetical protein